MATGPVTDAFIEIHPKFDSFDRELDRGIARAMGDIENRANRTFAGIEAAATAASKVIADSFGKGLENGSDELAELGSAAEAAFEDVDAAVLETVRQIEDSLNGVADGQPFAGIATDAERAGEQAEDALREIGNEGERQFDRIEREADDASNNIGSSIRRAAGIAATAFVGIQIGQFLVDGIDSAIAFENAMAEVATVLSAEAIDAGALDVVADVVEALQDDFGQLSTASIPAMYDALGAGIPAANILDFMTSAATAATAGATDLGTAVDGISSVVNAFGLDTISAAEAADQMFVAVQIGKTTFDELSRSLFQVNPVAAALGVEFADVAAAVGALTAQGVPTTVATTQIRSALAELGKEGQIAADNFTAIAGKTFPQFIAEGGNLVDAFALITESAEASGKSAIDMFGSIEAGQAVLALGGSTAFADALDATTNSAGAAQAAFDQFSGTTGFGLDQLKASFEQLKLGVFDAFGPALLVLFDAIGPVLDSLQAPLATLGEALASVIATLAPVFAELLTTLAPVVEVLGVALVDALGEIAPVIPDIAAAFADLLVALAPLIPLFVELLVEILQPILPVLPVLVEGLVILINAFVDLVDIVGPILPLLAGVAAAVLLLANPITALVIGGTLLVGMLGRLLDALGGFSGLASTVGGFFSSVGSSIAGFVSGAVPAIVGFFTDLPGTIVGALSGLGSAISGAFAAAFEFVVTELPGLAVDLLLFFALLPITIPLQMVSLAVTFLEVFATAFLAVITALPGLIGQVLAFFASLPGEAIGLLVNFGPMLFETFTSAFSSALGAVTSGIASIVGAIAGFIGDIPGYAGQVLRSMVTFGKNILQGIVDGVGNAAGFAADIASTISSAVKGVINRILRAIARPINIALDLLDKAAGPFVNFPEVSFPQLALGGIFDSPIIAQIAEAGREVVIPLTNPARAAALVEQSGLLDVLNKFHFGNDLSTSLPASVLGGGAAALGTAGVTIYGGLNVDVSVETTGGVSESDAEMIGGVVGSSTVEAMVARQALVDNRINRGGKA